MAAHAKDVGMEGEVRRWGLWEAMEVDAVCEQM